MTFTLRNVGPWAMVLGVLFCGIASAKTDGALAEAIKNRDFQAARTLLKQHADVNTPQPDGSTALHWAAHWANVEMVELLIAAGAKMNAANDYGVTPLSLACTNASAALVEKLLDAGANPNLAMRSGETPLMTCSRTGNTDAVRLLLEHKADVRAKETRGGQTALMWAVAQKHPGIVKLLTEHGADVHARSESGFTALLFAARGGDVDSARLLLDTGADVNEAPPVLGKEAWKIDGSPLLVAAAGGHEEMALFLLEKGANPNAADGQGITALHYAVLEGISAIGKAEAIQPFQPNHPKLAKALLARGANPNARIKKDYGFNSRPDYRAEISLVGATPFLLAAASGDVELMRLLKDNGADPRIATEENVTPLMVAAGVGTEWEEAKQAMYLEAAKLALDFGVDVHAVEKKGQQTALHGAVSLGADEVVQLLADHGADLNARNKKGQTPLSIAEGWPADKAYAAFVHPSTANLLRKLGATATAATPVKDKSAAPAVKVQ